MEKNIEQDAKKLLGFSIERISRMPGHEIMDDEHYREEIKINFPNSELSASSFAYFFYSDAKNIPQIEELLKKHELNYVHFYNHRTNKSFRDFLVFVDDNEVFSKKHNLIKLAFSYSEISRYQEIVQDILSKQD